MRDFDFTGENQNIGQPYLFTFRLQIGKGKQDATAFKERGDAAAGHPGPAGR
jgi:hypothetical protein